MAEPLRVESSTTEPATPEFAAMLAQMGGVLFSVETVQTTLELVTRLAEQTIPGSAGAGVTLVDSRGHRTTAASDPFVAEVDELQYAVESGPCLTAWSEQRPVRIDDLREETRWPRWTAAAAELGVRSMLSVPLVTSTGSVGAMKVYSRHRQAYDDRAEAVLSLFAQQAAVLLANMLTLTDARHLSGQLCNSLRTRDLIGQAKGVLMAQGVADEEAAFAVLIAASQRSHHKVQEVARQLIFATLDRHADGVHPRASQGP